MSSYLPVHIWTGMGASTNHCFASLASRVVYLLFVGETSFLVGKQGCSSVLLWQTLSVRHRVWQKNTAETLSICKHWE